MHFLKDRGYALPSSEVTPQATYHSRRDLLKLLATGAAGATLTAWAAREALAQTATARPNKLAALPGARSTIAGGMTMEKLTPYADLTSYNNFYEFGTDKSDPSENARTLRPRPWTVTIEGEAHKPQVMDVEQLLGWFPLEERVYRMRCVEAWSMVIPWVGFPLGDLLKRVEPTSRAKYVAFTTLLDPEQMPEQRRHVLDWPYVEGLRIDEAMHPLAILAVGLYGKALPNQNGAPLRLVVPWKYGFKGIKSIVKIRLTEEEPPTTWNLAAPHEYGFYANVNPTVDHPRWSQATERRIGEFRRRPTVPFNGYAEQVADLYAGMDLRRFF